MLIGRRDIRRGALLIDSIDMPLPNREAAHMKEKPDNPLETSRAQLKPPRGSEARRGERHGIAASESPRRPRRREKPSPQKEDKMTDKTAIRPFHVSFPEAELAELRRRVKLTRWPERELVLDASQGVQLATMQKLAQYWATEHDFHKCEARVEGASRISSPRSTGSTFISSTSARNIRARCRSSSHMGGPARSSSR